MANPIKIDDLGIPLFLETSIYIYIYMATQPPRLCESLVELKSYVKKVSEAPWSFVRWRRSVGGLVM